MRHWLKNRRHVLNCGEQLVVFNIRNAPQDSCETRIRNRLAKRRAAGSLGELSTATAAGDSGAIAAAKVEEIQALFA